MKEEGQFGLGPVKRLAVVGVLLGIMFHRPLIDWVTYAAKSSFYSHTLLVPAISAYLAVQKWRRIRVRVGRYWVSRSGLFWIGGLVILAVGSLSFYIIAARGDRSVARDDYLFLTLLPFLCLLGAGGIVTLGFETMRALAFPWFFLVFMLPFPVAVIHAVETFLQYASAEAAHLLFALGWTPYLRDGLRFDLPGLSLEIARECSGIRSSLVLFVTSLVAGHMFLESGWKRALLSFAVIPLGILRNAFRVFTIGTLASNIDVGIIDSAIHRRGGPLFFVLSLIPFLGLLWWLRRTELRPKQTAG